MSARDGGTSGSTADRRELVVRADDSADIDHVDETVSASMTADPVALIRYAIDQQVPVETLERLVALAERVSARHARNEFFAALSAFQGACGPIPRDAVARIVARKGGRFEYRYASLPGITSHIRPHLVQHGLSYTWDSVLDGETLRVTATLRHVGGHEQSAQFAAPIERMGADLSAAQHAAKVLTYAERMSLMQVLGMAAGDDDEAALAAGAHGDTGAPETISEDQAADIASLIGEVGADRGRFLRWLGVAAVSEIPADRAEEALAALEGKRRSGHPSPTAPPPDGGDS